MLCDGPVNLSSVARGSLELSAALLSAVCGVILGEFGVYCLPEVFNGVSVVDVLFGDDDSGFVFKADSDVEDSEGVDALIVEGGVFVELVCGNAGGGIDDSYDAGEELFCASGGSGCTAVGSAAVRAAVLTAVCASECCGELAFQVVGDGGLVVVHGGC